jgi:hypothetical protein
MGLANPASVPRSGSDRAAAIASPGSHSLGLAGAERTTHSRVCPFTPLQSHQPERFALLPVRFVWIRKMCAKQEREELPALIG